MQLSMFPLGVDYIQPAGNELRHASQTADTVNHGPLIPTKGHRVRSSMPFDWTFHHRRAAKISQAPTLLSQTEAL